MGVGNRGIIRPNIAGISDNHAGRLDALERPILSSAPRRPPKNQTVSAWLMAGSGSVTPSTGAFTAVSFGFTGDFPTIGHGLSWTIGDPTKIYVNTDLFVSIRVSVVANGANACIADMQVDYNGNSTGPFQYEDPFAYFNPITTSSGVFLQASYPPTPMAAGDVLQLMVRTSDGAFTTTFTDGLFVAAGT